MFSYKKAANLEIITWNSLSKQNKNSAPDYYYIFARF